MSSHPSLDGDWQRYGEPRRRVWRDRWESDKVHQARIKGDKLVFEKGCTVTLRELTSRTWFVPEDGEACTAELRDDGKLYWSGESRFFSGEVWIRKQEEQENRWSRLFCAADEDGNGTLDHREFRRLMQNLGSQLSKEELLQCFQMADRLKQRKVRFSDFVVWAMEVQDAEGSIKDGGDDGRYRDGYPPSGDHEGFSFPHSDKDFKPSRSVHRSVMKFHVLSEEKMHYVEARGAQMAHDNPWMPAKYAEVILVWTMECPIYRNITAMARLCGHKRKEWFEKYVDYCYYLNHALEYIPNHEGIVYRHVPVIPDVEDYVAGRVLTWNGPSSSSTEPQKSFLKDEGVDSKGRKKLSGTLFMLKSRFGKDIAPFSYFKTEKEILFTFNSMWSVDLRHKERTDFSGQEWLARQLYPYFDGYNWSGVCIIVMTQITAEELRERTSRPDYDFVWKHPY